MSGLSLYNGHRGHIERSTETRTMRGSLAKKDNAQECIFGMRREGWFFKRALIDQSNPDILELVFTRPAKS